PCQRPSAAPLPSPAEAADAAAGDVMPLSGVESRAANSVCSLPPLRGGGGGGGGGLILFASRILFACRLVLSACALPPPPAPSLALPRKRGRGRTEYAGLTCFKHDE